MYASLKWEIYEQFSDKRYLLKNLNEDETNFYNRILFKEASREEYEISIKKLSQYLEEYYNEKVVLLIDEYDVPIQCGYNKGFYNEVISFIKNFIGNSLKTNDSVFLSVMTGVLRVSRESIFSDLNNVGVYTAVDVSKENTKDMIEELILEKTIKIRYNEKVTFLDLDEVRKGDSKNIIGNFLLFSGYLSKANKNQFGNNEYIEVKIPNNEVRTVYRDIISAWTAKDAKVDDVTLYELT